MEGSRINFFYSSGRIYGITVRVRGRLSVFGLCRRGLFWRLGANIFSPVDGYWESMFGARYSIGNPYSTEPKLSLLFTLGMKDEKIILRVRPRGICGSISFSHTGCISFKFAELDTEVFSPLDNPNYQAFSSNQLEDKAIRGNENSEERY